MEIGKIVEIFRHRVAILGLDTFPLASDGDFEE
jgi:hypothetical protein